jgi:hypothetical protein
MHNNI